MYSDFVQRFLTYQTYGNWFKDLNPLSKLNILLVLSFISLVAQNMIFSLCLCIGYYLLAAYIGEFKYFNGIYTKVVATILLFLIVLRQLTVHGDTVLFSIFGWKWTLEALLVALKLSGILLGFSGAVILFYAATPMRDLMYVLEQKGVPHTTSYIILASFTTITDLNSTVKTIFESQKARGIEVEGNLITRIKAFFPILSPLLLGAMSAAEEKSISMDARAFSFDTKHTFLRELRPTPQREKIFVIAVDVIFAAVCVFRILQAFVF